MIEKIKKIISFFLSSEIIRYIISGGTVTLTNAVGYFVLLQVGMVYTVANIISLVLSKTVGYLLNKFFVYKSVTETPKDSLLELLRFALARGFTGIVDFVGLIILVEVFKVDERPGKIVIMLLVMVLNYILGKKAVFVKKGEN